MKYLILTLFAAFTLIGCKTTNSSGSPSPSPVLNTLKDIGCAVETDGANAAGQYVVNNCGAPAGNVAACSAAFQVALGNANLCTQNSIGSVTADQLNALRAAKKLGPAAYLAARQKILPVQLRGIVGALACPVIDNVLVGVASSQIPTACGCTTNLNDPLINTSFVAFCEGLIPL